jgi:peptidoglycan/LPS O-acetylase OafA/YrhL
VTHPAPDRLHALDAVRGFALLLGVALHGALSYLPGAERFWLLGDQPSYALASLFWWTHVFRMTLFFLIAGFFGRLLLERIGLRAFLRDRGRRVVGVLLAGWPLVFTAIVLALALCVAAKNGGTLPPSPPPPAMNAQNFPLTHLWFLYVLTMFYAGALMLRGLFAWLDRRGYALRHVDALLPYLLHPLGLVALAAPAALALAFTPKWPMWFGVPTPDTGLVPNLAALVAYGCAFAAGWLLQRQPTLLARIADARLAYLGIALAASGLCLWLVGATPVLSPAPEDATKWVYAGAYALAGWAWALALLGLALRHVNGYSPVRRYLADASYWIYLVHLPLVMALQALTFSLRLPWWLEYPALLAVAMALMLASYELLVRHGRIGEWLNGKRVPRVAAHAAKAAHVAG